VKAPDVPWGNNPDPAAVPIDPRAAAPLFMARRTE